MGGRKEKAASLWGQRARAEGAGESQWKCPPYDEFTEKGFPQTTTGVNGVEEENAKQMRASTAGKRLAAGYGKAALREHRWDDGSLGRRGANKESLQGCCWTYSLNPSSCSRGYRKPPVPGRELRSLQTATALGLNARLRDPLGQFHNPDNRRNRAPDAVLIPLNPAQAPDTSRFRWVLSLRVCRSSAQAPCANEKFCPSLAQTIMRSWSGNALSYSAPTDLKKPHVGVASCF